MINHIWQFPGLLFVKISMYAENYQNIHMFKEKMASFTFSSFWTSAKSRPMITGNVLGNINVSAKVHQNTVYDIDFVSRIWTSTKPRPLANCIWQSLYLVNILSISMQNLPKYQHGSVYFLVFYIFMISFRMFAKCHLQPLGLDLINTRVSISLCVPKFI